MKYTNFLLMFLISALVATVLGVKTVLFILGCAVLLGLISRFFFIEKEDKGENHI